MLHCEFKVEKTSVNKARAASHKHQDCDESPNIEMKTTSVKICWGILLCHVQFPTDSNRKKSGKKNQGNKSNECWCRLAIPALTIYLLPELPGEAEGRGAAIWRMMHCGV